MAKKPDQIEAEKLIRKKISAYKTSLNSPAGKEMFDDLLRSYYYRPLFDPNSTVMASKVGARDLLQKMMDFRDADPKNVHIEVKT